MPRDREGARELISPEKLRQIGSTLTPVQVADLVKVSLHQMLSGWRSIDSRHSLTPTEVKELLESGFDLEAVDYGQGDPLIRGASEFAALVASSLSVADAANVLGVEGSRVRQRLLARTLYGIKVGHEWRLPSFQFAFGRAVPGIEGVFPELDPHLHPLAVYHWFTLPNVDLVPDESRKDEDEGAEPLSPRDWLLSGRDPGVVADLARDL